MAANSLRALPPEAAPCGAPAAASWLLGWHGRRGHHPEGLTVPKDRVSMVSLLGMVAMVLGTLRSSERETTKQPVRIGANNHFILS